MCWDNYLTFKFRLIRAIISPKKCFPFMGSIYGTQPRKRHPILLTILNTSKDSMATNPGYSFGHSNELCVIKEDTEYHDKGAVSRPRYLSRDEDSVYTSYLIKSNEKEAIDVFNSRLSGYGMLVKKKSRRGNKFRLRRLSFMGKHLYVSSLRCTKEINIETIRSCKSTGRILAIDTKEYGSVVLKTPRPREAFSIGAVLSSRRY